MSLKHLIPSFRARYRFLEQSVAAAAEASRTGLGRVLNVGCGEGDFDTMLRAHCRELVCVDLSETDIAHARARNAATPGIHYAVEDALALSFPDGRFDLVCCTEVIEHVRDPVALLRELARVAGRGKPVVLTGPNRDFPVTYDPINRVLARVGKHLPIGGYAYGHTWLVDDAELRGWCDDIGLEVVASEHLTGALAALPEAYTLGLLQALLKANAKNDGGPGRAFALKPKATRAPGLARVTDLVNGLDRARLARGAPSVGLGYVLRVR
jgi:2-polyprenyl-3-methyl-5-hydroxy-6-metoxy-1,4-benzoquinol methylase